MSNVQIEGTDTEQDNVILRVDGLHKTFSLKSASKKNETFALRGISFSIHKGETVAIVGESGSGKTTLARTIVGLETPTRGKITFESSALKFNKETRKNISFVFQDPYASLNPRMTISSLLKEPLHLLTNEELKELSDSASQENKNGEVAADGEESSSRKTLIKNYISHLLEQVQLLPQWSQRYAHELSGGQRQRIGIARAISTSPKLMVMDEPVSSLDVSVQAGIIQLLQEIKNRNEMSMLFITHDLRIVRYLCDRVVVMYLGQIMEDASIEQLFSHPCHPYSKALIEAIPKRPDEDVVTRTIAENLEPGETTTNAPKYKVLKGEVPSSQNPPKGCPFKTRCEKATDECDNPPPLAQMTDGRLVACHFPY